MKFIVTRPEGDRYAAYLPEFEQEIVYWECARCEAIIWTGPSDFERMYDEFYYKMEGDEFLQTRFRYIISLPPESSDNWQRVNRIKDFLNRYNCKTPSETLKEVLDIGAGLGVFLYRFMDEFWRGTAVEPNLNACTHIREVLPGVEVIPGYFDEVKLTKQYDLITLNRVLEHIADPLPVLRKVRKLLKEGGIAYIEVPDVRSYYYNGSHDQDFGAGHYIIYSPTALTYLTSRAGLELISMHRVVEPSSKYTLYAFFKAKLSLCPGKT